MSRWELFTDPTNEYAKIAWHPYLAREWRQYLVGRDLRRFDYTMRRGTSGVYFLFVGDDLTYIGQSQQIATRVKQHRRCGRPFTSYGFVDVPGDVAEAVEIAYIHALKPSGNGFIDSPKFYQHYEMVETIKRLWENVPHHSAVPADISAIACGTRDGLSA